MDSYQLSELMKGRRFNMGVMNGDVFEVFGILDPEQWIVYAGERLNDQRKIVTLDKLGKRFEITYEHSSGDLYKAVIDSSYVSKKAMILGWIGQVTIFDGSDKTKAVGVLCDERMCPRIE